jgi:hypothetical protein
MSFKSRKNRKSAKAINEFKSYENLMDFYWGYKANDHDNGFEFSTKTALAFGLSMKEAIDWGVRTKKVVDKQLKVFKTNTTMKHYGLTKEEFVAEEKARMIGTTNNLNILTSKQFQIQDILQDLIIWCCAVSTCVIAGELEQDKWNGDEFRYVQSSIPNFKDIMLKETA